LFRRQPTSQAVRAFLSRAMHDAQATPKHLISDKGSQFWCDGFKEWCRDNGIKPRFGAIGQHGSIAITERLILTLKQGIGWFLLVLLRREAFRTMLGHLAAWYNAHRPHASLAGRTPDEVYHRKRAANHQPRFEPRPRWPRASGCAKPVMLVKGAPGVRRDASASTFSSVFGAHGARRRANQTTFRHQITLVIDCFHF
jgi:transposase InsO family protein